MIELQRFGDVERVRLASLGSRIAGLDVSAYLVRGILIDSGFPRARGAMLTHYHEDHAGNAELLAARGIPLAMHQTTLARLREPSPIRVYRRLVWGTPSPLASTVRSLEQPPLRFVFTPGHSPDHQIVWDPERATLFSGDLWLGVRSSVLHVSENPFRIIESLRAVLALHPERMFDAHRGPVRDPIPALAAKINYLEETIAAVAAKLASGWSDQAILRAVLGGDEAVARFSGGEYSRLNFVKAVRRALTAETAGAVGIERSP